MIQDFSYPAPGGTLAHPIAEHGPALLVFTDGLLPPDLEAAVDAAGLQWLDTIGLRDAAARPEASLAGEVLLLCCPAGASDPEPLLVGLDRLAEERAMPLVVIADVDTLDLAYACIRSDRAQLLCRPDRADLMAALVTAAEEARADAAVHDRGKDSDSARLQQLSEEVSRLARTIEALTRRSRSAPPSFDGGPRISDRPADYIGMPATSPLGADTQAEEAVHVTPGQVRDLLRARRMRADFLPGDLFADPAWDMMLDLLAARLEHERVSVSSLCIAAAVPPTTALRWIRTLTDQGLVERQNDPRDGRRVFISLTQEAAQSLTRWFGASRRYRCA